MVSLLALAWLAPWCYLLYRRGCSFINKLIKGSTVCPQFHFSPWWDSLADMIHFVNAILHMTVWHLLHHNYSGGLLLALSRLNLRADSCRYCFNDILMNDGFYILSKWIKLCCCCICTCWKKIILDLIQVEVNLW